MDTSRKLSTVSSAILIASLTACGGGGGGGGGEEAPRNPEPTLTTLPAFLQGNEAQCTFTESGSPVSLVDYTGNLGNVTGLTCTGVTLSDLNEINLLTALQQLSLENSGLTNVNELLNNLTLKQLDVSGNPIADLTVINSLLNLTELDLENTGLADISLLEALTALQKLDLSGNGIASVTALGNLLSLTDLDISGNNISKLNDLGSLTNLQNLDVSGNPSLSCAEINDLDLALAGGTNITLPSICTTALFLSAASDASQSLDNSAASEPFDRLVVKDVTGLNDVEIFQNDDNLHLQATTNGGNKTITFTSWFVDDAYKVDEFEIENVGVYSFTQLRNAIGLGLALTEGRDTYLGTNAKDVIYGLGDVDVIAGGSDADTIIGGKGDDKLSDYVLTVNEDGSVSREGSSYDTYVDTFIFNSGDGNDTLYLYEISGNKDLLLFTDSITEDDISLLRDGNHLKMELSETDSVTVFNWFSNSTYQLGQIQFGSAEPVAAVSWVNNKGFASVNSTILGTNASEVLNGSTEDDIIIAGGGKDTIVGGKGDDKLSDHILTVNDDGSVSRETTSYDTYVDTFIFNSGDGNDTLYLYEISGNKDLLLFTGSITEDDITLYRDGDNLKMVLSDTDSVTVFNWFSNSTYQLGQIQFGSAEPIAAASWVRDKGFYSSNYKLLGTNDAEVLLGGVEDDIIIAGSGADTIIGGKGDDKLSDHILTVNDDDSVSRETTSYDTYVDTFIFNSGDGNDTLYLYEISGHKDLLLFTGSITEDDITLYRDGDNLKMVLSDTDSVTVFNWFVRSEYKLGQIQFGNAEPIAAASWVKDKGFYSSNYKLFGTNDAEVLLGGIEDDIIIAGSGADTIIGGKGNDKLSDHVLTVNDDDTVSREGSSYDAHIDTFIFNSGDGNDTLYLYEISGNRDLLQFGSGISATSITAEQIDNDLKLTIVTIESTDTITIKNWFGRSSYRLGQIQFDGQDPLNAEEFVNGLLTP